MFLEFNISNKYIRTLNTFENSIVAAEYKKSSIFNQSLQNCNESARDRLEIRATDLTFIFHSI